MLQGKLILCSTMQRKTQALDSNCSSLVNCEEIFVVVIIMFNCRKIFTRAVRKEVGSNQICFPCNYHYSGGF